MCNLAYLYEKGIDGAPDYVKAKELYEQAAAYNYPRGYASLGFLYEDGLGVDKDLNKAFECS